MVHTDVSWFDMDPPPPVTLNPSELLNVDSQGGCLLELNTWMSMGEKMLEWTIRCSAPVCFLQEWMERVFQSVQNRVSSYRVRAKG